MKRLPTLLLTAGLTLAGLVLYLWQTHTKAAMPSIVVLSLRVLDVEGYPLAGAEIVQLHELQREAVGVSDAFGRWQGRLSIGRGNALELHINKQTAVALLQARRTYPTGQGQLQDSIRLQATPPRSAFSRSPAQTTTRSPRKDYLRLEVATPYLHQALLGWSQQAGMPIAAHGERVLAVQDVKDGHLQVSLSTSARDLFSFQVAYRQLDSQDTVQKILRGIYAHSKHTYTAWYEEKDDRWYVYNPAGFWHLQTDAVLINAQGQQFYPHPQQPRMRQQLELGGSENVCSQRECVVYSAHAKQDVY